MQDKQTHDHNFSVSLNRTIGRSGRLSAPELVNTIEVATPPAFEGGVPGIWSPEHLFLGALSSCLMTTYLAIAAKRRLAVHDFSCKASGQVQLQAGVLEFTSVDLYPTVYVESESDVALANEVLLKAYKHCIVANSVKSMLVHHGKVLVTLPDELETATGKSHHFPVL